MGPFPSGGPAADVYPSREAGSGRPLRRRPSSGSMRDFLTIVFRHFGLVAAIFLTTLLGTAIWMTLEPESYEVSARIMLRFARESADPRTSLNPTTTRVLPATRPDINTEAELIKSPAIVEQVVVDLGLDKPYARPVPAGFFPRIKYELRQAYDQVKQRLDELQITLGLKERLSPKEIAVVKIMKGLKVESVRDSSVVKATLTTNIRTGSSKILNALLEAYREHRLAVEKNSREIVFFGDQAQQSHRDLLGAEQKLYDLKRKYDLASLPDQVNLTLRNVSDTERAVKDSQSQVAASEAKVRALQAQIGAQPKSSVVNETDNRNSALDALIERRDALNLERQKALGKYGNDHPEIRSLDEQIALVGKLIAATPNSVPQTRTTAVNSTYLDLQKELLNAQQTLAAQRAQLVAQRAALNDYRSNFESLREAQLAYTQLSRDVSIGDEAYRLNERNAMEARAAEVLRSQGISSIEIVDPAIDPILPSGIRKIYLLGSALLVGLLLSIGAAVLSDSLDHSIHTPMDVERYAGLDVLGCIGYAKPAALIPPRGRAVAELIQLATKLDRKHARGARAIAICGASAGARTDVVASAIACTFSVEFARKTLLVGIDGGFGGCAKLFGKPADRLSTGSLISTGDSLDLMYLPGKGPVPGDLADRLRALLAEHPDYERVLIDLGSSAPDTWITAANQATGGVLLVVGAESTRREVLERWEHVARAEDYRVLGAVLDGRRYPIPGPIYRWWS